MKINNIEILNIFNELTIKNKLDLIDSSTWIKNIINARKFLIPSSIYGYRYGRNTAAIWNLRPSAGYDLFITDNDGILLNNVGAESAKKRIRDAKAKSVPVVYFFGGSTMMGMGCGLPENTIPSLVESKIKNELGLDSVCINLGVGGTHSGEALTHLIYGGMLMLDSSPDLVVYYDGWNCCSYLNLIHSAADEIERASLISAAPIQGLRHLEHDYALYNLYSLSWLINRSIKILICNLFQMVNNFMVFKIDALEKFINKTQNLLINPSSSSALQDILKKKDYNVSFNEKSADDYIKIHYLAKRICENNSVRFLSFMQPVIFLGSKKLTSQEKKFKEVDVGIANMYESFYEKIKRSGYFENDWATDLTDVFRDEIEELYIDSGHLNQNGNAIIADAIFSKIKALL
jgi:hypothetical protein